MANGDVQSVQELGRMMGLKFGDLGRRMKGLETAVKEQTGDCKGCKEGLKDNIEGAREYARLLMQAAIEKITDEMLSKHRDHENRLRVVEKARWKLAGAVGFGSAIIGSFAGIAAGALGRWLVERFMG